MILAIQLFIAVSIGAVIGFIFAGIMSSTDADCDTCPLVERGEKD